MLQTFEDPLDLNTTNITSNQITNETGVKSFPPIPLTRFIGIGVGVCACVAILTNVLVLIVISFSQKNKIYSTYGFLISHLALVDLLCSICYLPYIPIELEQHNWIYKEESCKIVYPSMTILTNLSVGTILIIAVDRYRGVIFPYKSPWKPRNLKVAIAIVWIAGFVIVLPAILTLKVTQYENVRYCNEKWDDTPFLREHKYLRKVYGIFYFCTAFALPALLMIFMHTSIMYRLKRPELRPDNQSQYQVRTNTRIMRVLSAVIFAFIVCVSPNKLLYFVWDLRPDLEVSFSSKARLYLRTFQILYYSRTAINPLIYCVFDTRFKKDFTNTSKVIRGLSFADSDIAKSRSRTLSNRNGSILALRSRASSSLNEAGHPPNLNAHIFAPDLISKLSTVAECAHDKPGCIAYITSERLRSASDVISNHTAYINDSPEEKKD